MCKSWYVEGPQLYEQHYYLAIKWDIHWFLSYKDKLSAVLKKHINLCPWQDLSWGFPTSLFILFFPFLSQVCFFLPSASHSCWGFQGHFNTRSLTQDSLNSLCSKIIFPHPQTRILVGITPLVFLRVCRFPLWSNEYLHIAGVSCWTLKSLCSLSNCVKS